MLTGRTVRGKGLGAKYGFPTVNVEPCPGTVLPMCGVYAVKVGSAPAIANLGYAPTMEAAAWEKPVLEIHFAGNPPSYFSGDASVNAQFVRFVRPERRFASREELFAQIAEDCKWIL